MNVGLTSNVRKLVTLDALLAERERHRAAGRTVVHCHGCFDIVHPGHIHHLQYARSLGDVLVVSVSADRHVNKGIDRPLIPDDLRAASLGALECVDLVYLSPQPTAVELLTALQPDVYVKGKEYERNNDPRFLAERDAVTEAGGRVVFSSGDIVYSSTALIDALPKTDQFHHEKLQRFCDRYDLSLQNLTALTRKFAGRKVLVLGDYILDRYHFCEASGIAGEGPMMALRAMETRDFDGGAAVVALHLAGLGASPTLVTTLADDAPSARIEQRLISAGVATVAARTRPSIVSKHRYLADDTKLFKVDEGSVSPLDSRAEETLAEQILAAADGAAGVIFADFGYGLITSGLLDRVLAPLRATVPILTADVSGRQSNLLRFRNVDLLCPTEREVRDTLQDHGSGLGAVVSKLLQSTGARQSLITLGKQGLVSFDWPGGSPAGSDYRLRSEYLPAFSSHTIDPLGCGDALLATASLVLSAGGSLQAAALLGSMAASVEVQSLGNVPLTTESLARAINDRAPSLATQRESTITRLAS